MGKTLLSKKAKLFLLSRPFLFARSFFLTLLEDLSDKDREEALGSTVTKIVL